MTSMPVRILVSRHAIDSHSLPSWGGPLTQRVSRCPSRARAAVSAAWEAVMPHPATESAGSTGAPVGAAWASMAMAVVESNVRAARTIAGDAARSASASLAP